MGLPGRPSAACFCICLPKGVPSTASGVCQVQQPPTDTGETGVHSPAPSPLGWSTRGLGCTLLPSVPPAPAARPAPPDTTAFFAFLPSLPLVHAHGGWFPGSPLKHTAHSGILVSGSASGRTQTETLALALIFTATLQVSYRHTPLHRCRNRLREVKALAEMHGTRINSRSRTRSKVS